MPNSDFENLLKVVRDARFEGVPHGSKKLVAVRRSLMLHSTSPGYFFGDLKLGKYFVSDYIRDLFGFDGNVVKRFPQQVTGRMCSEEDRIIHSKAIEELLADVSHESQFSREWYFRVRDCTGQIVWVWVSVDVFRSSMHPVMIAGAVSVLNTMALAADSRRFFAYGVMLKDLISLLNRFDGWGAWCYVLPQMSRNEGGNPSGQNFMRTALSMALSGRKDGDIRFFRLKDNVGIVFIDPKVAEGERAKRVIEEVLEENCAKLGIAFEHAAHVKSVGGETGSELSKAFRKIVGYLRQEVEFDDRGIMGPGGFQNLTFAELFTLGDACRNDFEGFGIVIQPLVDRKTRRVIGGEVLLRMSEGKQPLGPDKFVPIFENSRLMVPLGRHLVDRAVMLAGRCVAIDPDFVMSINVSGAQTSDPNLLSFIKAALAVHDLQGRNFMIEITESYGVESEQVVSTFLEGCRQIGMRTAIDDFGEGFSSVRRLLSGEFDVVKVGAELSGCALRQLSSRQFLDNLIGAFSRLGVKVCLEGVENLEALKVFDEMDCDIYQGYHFGKPMKGEEFLKLLKESRKRTE